MDSLISLYAQFEEAQANFDSRPVLAWFSSHWEIPIFAVGIYYAMVHGVPKMMEGRKPLPLRPIFALWNLFLTVFSVYGGSVVIPATISALSRLGVYGLICGDPHEELKFYSGPVGFWCLMFCLSKIPELLDTAFLVFQKKPVIFLHWYHHITVCLYCWHAYIHTISAGFTFAAMNYGVHSIMYAYYFMMAINMKGIVKPLAPFITILQISQMVVGMIWMTYVLLKTEDGNPDSCHATETNARFGFVMYASYFFLFAKLFLNNYIFKKKRSAKSAETNKAETVSEPNSSAAALGGARRRIK